MIKNYDEGIVITKEVKQEIIKKNAQSDNDTGSTAIQIALLTKRIAEISEHLKKFKKDNHSRKGLLKLVSQRKRLEKYMKRQKRVVTHL
ncbi:30S ribosomal protein S15 [Candidatus Dependentiae bacterium]|nr:MAG: 30S ribosomal protein S15 [Candidatus Dependentiae bacterium]